MKVQKKPKKCMLCGVKRKKKEKFHPAITPHEGLDDSFVEAMHGSAPDDWLWDKTKPRAWFCETCFQGIVAAVSVGDFFGLFESLDAEDFKSVQDKVHELLGYRECDASGQALLAALWFMMSFNKTIKGEET